MNGWGQKIEKLIDSIRFIGIQVEDRTDAPQKRVVEAGGGRPEKETGRLPGQPRVGTDKQMTGFFRR